MWCQRATVVYSMFVYVPMYNAVTQYICCLKLVSIRVPPYITLHVLVNAFVIWVLLYQLLPPVHKLSTMVNNCKWSGSHSARGPPATAFWTGISVHTLSYTTA